MVFVSSTLKESVRLRTTTSYMVSPTKSINRSVANVEQPCHNQIEYRPWLGE
jgi:hypothetical protein